jgi:hypothetical protein
MSTPGIGRLPPGANRAPVDGSRPTVDRGERPLCRDSGGSLIDNAGLCFCFITVILAFASFCTNAFGIAFFAGKLIMAFVVA